MKAPGLTPEEVEQRITVPIELELLGLPNKKILRSTTKYALADITVDFEDGTDIYWARNQVSERLSNIARDLPEGVTGGLAPITSPLGEMFMFTIDSPDLSLAERRSLLDWVIRPALRTVPGVADVNSLGGHVRAFEIVPLSDALAAHGISYDLFRRAIETNSRNDGAGRVNQGEDSALVRIEGSIRTIERHQAIVVDTKDGIPIRVNDIARVQVGSLTRYGAVTADGRGETVEGLVLGLRGANARQLVSDVRAAPDELKPWLPQGVTINVFYDRSRLVDRAVGTVIRALGEATVLVIVLLLLFLGNWRASLVIALSLPLAIIIALIVMRIGRHVGEPDEPGRPCHRHRHADRRLGGRRRKRRGKSQQGSGGKGRAARPYYFPLGLRGAGAGRNRAYSSSSSFSCRCLRCRDLRESCSSLSRSRSSLRWPPRCCWRSRLFR